MHTVGRIPVSWNDSYKEFAYVKQPVTDQEIKTWEAKGYKNISYTGSLYDNTNPMPEFVNKIKNDLDPRLTHATFTFYKMVTLDIMPEHLDHFKRYCELFNCRPENVQRYLVFLENWKPGHYFEIEGNGIINWQAGDFVQWGHTTPHAASNIGTAPRYTLQVTTHD